MVGYDLPLVMTSLPVHMPSAEEDGDEGADLAVTEPESAPVDPVASALENLRKRGIDPSKIP